MTDEFIIHRITDALREIYKALELIQDAMPERIGSNIYELAKQIRELEIREMENWRENK